ncbi:MAG TPA: ferredoxin [Archaeoglobus veneficus]|nr:ferredoxin [Archaeoglobus veneficus]
MIIVTKNCVGCALCKLVCKEFAIEVFGKAKIDYEKCVKCKKCIIYCPLEAIRVVE